MFYRYAERSTYVLFTKLNAISLEESVSTTAARTTAGYQKTGDLITLPYTEEAFHRTTLCIKSGKGYTTFIS